MNKLVFAVGCCGLLGAAFAVETAFEGQSIGTIALDPGTKSTIVSVAFNELSPTDGAEITAANLVSTKNLTDGDTIHIYTGSGYKTWVKNGAVWETPAAKVSNDANGQTSVEDGTAPEEVGSTIGSGFWLIRKDASTPFYIYGACVKPSATKAVHGVKTLMGNPVIDKSTATPTIAGAAKFDSISIANGDGKLLKMYTCGKDGLWFEQGSNVGKTSVTFPKGIGFWYNSRGSEDVTFTW